MLVLIKSQNQEAQIYKETLNKAPTVRASSLGFVHSALHVPAAWSMQAHSAPQRANLPWVTQNKQTTVPAEKLSLRLWSPSANSTRSTRSDPGDPVLPLSSSKGRPGRRKLLWDRLAGQVLQTAEQHHVNISFIIQQA